MDADTIAQTKLRAPFPWFGGKSRVSDLIWGYFGNVPNYVEPFLGSAAVLLGRPHAPDIETVNDKDCYLANFWRAVQHDPEAVAWHADQPVNEADLHARHLWLVCQEGFRDRMLTDPDHYDVKIAGWWVWGISCWIGSGWCSMPQWAGRINAAHTPKGIHVKSRNAGNEVWKKRPELKRGGRGVARQIPDLGGDSGAAGRGVHGSGRNDDKTESIIGWMQVLCARLRNTRVCCGDWARVLGRSPTECIGVTAVLLDPPYGTRAGRGANLYNEDCLKIAAEVRDWAVAQGDNRMLRICLCGYQDEHDMPADWRVVEWKANGGYGNSGAGKGRENALRERLWFSPHCLDPEVQPELFPTKNPPTATPISTT